MADRVALSTYVSKELGEKVLLVAASLDRSVSWVIAEAIRESIERKLAETSQNRKDPNNV
jgi:predicted transcriptional regulator